MVYCYNVMLFSNKKKGTIDTKNNLVSLKSIMLSERTQSQKGTHCIIPFI